MPDERKGYLELIIFSILAGSVAVFVRLVNNLDVYAIVFFRAFIATLFILLVVLFRKRIKELSLNQPVKTIFVGVFQGLSILLYFGAILTTSISNAIFLLFTAPIFSIILARIFFKERIERATIIGFFATFAGIIFIIDPRTLSFSSTETLGNLMALGAGFFYSAMALTSKKTMKKASGYYTAFWQYLIISLIFLFFLKPISPAVVYDNWWQLLTIGILCTGIAFIFFMEGVRKVKAQKIFIVASLEPLTGTILALFLLGETPPLLTVIGAILILYGVYRITKKQTDS